MIIKLREIRVSADSSKSSQDWKHIHREEFDFDESLLVNQLTDFFTNKWDDVEQMLSAGAETAQSLGMQPYYMYRQKYMSGNLENVGYAKQD